MRPETANRGREARLLKAIDEIKNAKTIPRAAAQNHVPKSTVFDRLIALQENPAPNPRTAFLAEEETTFVDFVVHCADVGVPLSTTHLLEAAISFIQTLLLLGQQQLPFKNGKPGLH